MCIARITRNCLTLFSPILHYNIENNHNQLIIIVLVEYSDSHLPHKRQFRKRLSLFLCSPSSVAFSCIFGVVAGLEFFGGDVFGLFCSRRGTLVSQRERFGLFLLPAGNLGGRVDGRTAANAGLIRQDTFPDTPVNPCPGRNRGPASRRRGRRPRFFGSRR